MLAGKCRSSVGQVTTEFMVDSRVASRSVTYYLNFVRIRFFLKTFAIMDKLIQEKEISNDGNSGDENEEICS